MFLGTVPAGGRRTVAAWIRAGGVRINRLRCRRTDVRKVTHFTG
jgi:hypothetical protein